MGLLLGGAGHGTTKFVPECIIYNSVSVSVSTGGGFTTLTFDSQDLNVCNLHSTSINSSRITFEYPGRYLIMGTFAWAADSTSYRDISIITNGSTLIGSKHMWPLVSTAWLMTISVMDHMAAGDYLTVRARVGAATGAISLDDFRIHAVRLPNGPYCSVGRSAAQSIPDNTRTAISFTAENSDFWNMHSTVTNPTRITVPYGGWYAAFGQARWAGSTVGFREMRIAVNDTAGDFIDAGSGANLTVPDTNIVTQAQILTFLNLNANDYIEMVVGHNIGASLNIQAAGNATPSFNVAFLDH